jgi:hypothetical protein
MIKMFINNPDLELSGELDIDDDDKQELLKEAREEPFWNWVESLSADELIEMTYDTKKEFISSHKDTLIESFNDLD